jgi:hypothetical protein
MTSDRLEERLFDLGAALRTPTAPDLVPAVMARLPEPRAVRARRTGLRFHRPRRALALSLGAALLLSGTAMAVPPSRDAILSVLGLRGVRIERVSRPPALPAGAGTRLGLGLRIPLDRASHAAGFAALLPPHATAAYLAHDVPGGRISFIAGPALVIELRATVTPFFVKFIGPGTRMRRVRVNGGPGAYLSGALHDVLFQASGTVQTDRVRIAGNVLIWQQRPLTLRIEGARTLGAALAIARSLH